MHETKVGKVWVQWGWMKAFSLGIHISSMQFSIDFIIFYIQLEFPLSKRARNKKWEKKASKLSEFDDDIKP